MALSREQVEDVMDITLFTDWPASGVTEVSKAQFEEHRMHPGNVRKVILAYVTEPSWGFLTYLVDDDHDGLCFDGFSWGYGGTGCRGLMWLFDQLHWKVNPADLPPAHEEGVWEVVPMRAVDGGWECEVSKYGGFG